MVVYRNGELSSAMVDIGWPHQVALPAVVSLNNGYKAVDAFCKELSLCPRRDRVVLAGQFPSAATPRNSCSGSAANGSIRSKEVRAGIGCRGRSEERGRRENVAQAALALTTKNK
jgi:hypothetical protein